MSISEFRGIVVQANYSVQFDDYIAFFSANDYETHYQQPLFGFTFNVSGVHFLSIKSIHVDENKWLDLDYITITVNDTDRLVYIW